MEVYATPDDANREMKSFAEFEERRMGRTEREKGIVVVR